MANNNYKCPKTGKEFFFPVHRTIFTSEGAVYKDKYGNELINPENGEKLVPIPPAPVEDYSGVSFVSSGKEGKAKMINHLKKRSKDHFKKEIKEKKDDIIKKSNPYSK